MKRHELDMLHHDKAFEFSVSPYHLALNVHTNKSVIQDCRISAQ